MKGRTHTWLALVVVAIGLALAGIVGLFVYMSVMATPLHPDPQGVPSVTRSTAPPAWADAIERGRQIARAGLLAQNLPGISVAVGTGGDVVWAEGFGWADVENRVPVAPEMRFRIGTASTVLTSAAVGLLLEKDRLKLDERIQTYVPEFPEKQWPVTLRQVMGHLAGVRSDGGDEGPLLGAHCERAVDALPSFKDRPLLFEPGTQYRVSRYGWILVSAAVEHVTNEPFLSFMRRQIFEPLRMEDTEADSAGEPVPNRVTPYFPKFGADPRYGPDLMRPVEYSCYAGSSVFVSTPSDLVRFAMAIASGRLVKPATLRLLQTSQRLPSGQQTGYGLGWDLETVALAGQQSTAVGHDGDVLGGTVASLWTFPERGIVVAVTSNISYAHTFALATDIAAAFAEHGSGPARK